MSVKTIYDGDISEGTAKRLKAGSNKEEILAEVPFEWGDGVDSAVLKTPSDEARANTVSGDWSVAIGSRNQALGTECLAAGGNSVAGHPETEPGADDAANDCFALGYRAEATGNNSFVAGGYRNKATGNESHVEGKQNQATYIAGHAEGEGTQSLGEATHSEGQSTIARKGGAHSEGVDTDAGATASHTEGKESKVEDGADAGHAEGYKTTVSARYAHAENQECTASGVNSHAGGYKSVASGEHSFAHGDSCFAKDLDSIVLGTNNASTRSSQTVVGRWSSDANGGNSGVDTTAFFAVGAGNWNRVGQCCLQAGYGNVDGSGEDRHYIKIGNTVLTEAALRTLLGLN